MAIIVMTTKSSVSEKADFRVLVSIIPLAMFSRVCELHFVIHTL